MANWTYSGTDLNQLNTGAINKGYFVKLPDIDPATYEGGKTKSAYLENKQQDTIALWITEASIPFQIAGTWGQSRRLREWFPRNLVQATWKLKGICPNSFQLQRLGQFIRESNLESLNLQSLEVGEFTKLVIEPGNLRAGKGSHSGWSMHGYIPQFKRGAVRFENAPSYEFEFAILYAQSAENIININQSEPSRLIPNKSTTSSQERLNEYINYGAPSPTRSK